MTVSVKETMQAIEDAKVNIIKNLPITSRQPSNAGGFRRLAFTKPANHGGKQR